MHTGAVLGGPLDMPWCCPIIGVMGDFMGFEASGAEIPIYGECHGQKKGRPDSLEFVSL